jgi:hypothetical protein
MWIGMTRSSNPRSTEVAVARIYDGVHYRNSTATGAAMGNKIGELVARSVAKARR